jgi:hypothetical protein
LALGDRKRWARRAHRSYGTSIRDYLSDTTLGGSRWPLGWCAGQGIALVTVMMAMACGVTLGIQGSAASPDGTSVILLSSSQWGPDSIGFEHVVGEVKNVGTTDIDYVQINLNFYSASGNLVGTDETFTTVDELAPGGKSPFEDDFSPPPGYNHFSVASINPSVASGPPNHYFITKVTSVYVDALGDTNYVGTVLNYNKTTSSFVNVVFTFYNGGRAVAQDETYINSDSDADLGPNKTASFQEDLGTSDPAFPHYTSYATVTQSDTPPDPGKPPPPPPPPPPLPKFVGIAATADGNGYWLLRADGLVKAYGDAQWYGNQSTNGLATPLVGITATLDGKGYWVVTAGGGVYAFGDAKLYGSEGGHKLKKPIVGIAITKDGHGYYLVASDGGIFAFGDAKFYGSTGSIKLKAPVVGMAVDDHTGGYWMVAADGGIFAFDAHFYGSTGSLHLTKPIIQMEALAAGDGYRFVASDGGIFDFGAAHYSGSLGGRHIESPVTGMASEPGGTGYWLLHVTSQS